MNEKTELNILIAVNGIKQPTDLDKSTYSDFTGTNIILSYTQYMRHVVAIYTISRVDL